MRAVAERAVGRRAARVLMVIGAVASLCLSLAALALPASAQASRPSYDVHQILSGQRLGHWYTRAGSSKRHWERLSSPDDITTFDGNLFTTFQNGVGPQGQASPDGNLTAPSWSSPRAVRCCTSGTSAASATA
jgi:hypothetical protein